MLLHNKVILITGGTSGVGRELVEQLASSNTLIVLGRNLKKLKSLAQAHPKLDSYACDLSDGRALLATVSRIIERHPDLSVVINNAGIQYTPPFLSTRFDYNTIEREIAVNLTAPVAICALAIPHLRQRAAGAAVVNISSGLAYFPKVDSSVYCATKAALHSFSTSLRYQLEDTPITVHEAILPLVDTPMTRGRGSGKISPAKAARDVIAGVGRGKANIFVGKARFIPLITRLSPALMAKILRSG